MKKIIVLALLLVGIQANAQFIGSAGYIYSSEKTTEKSNGNSEAVPFHGFFVGGSYNIQLGKGFGFAPGLYATYLIHNENADEGGRVLGYSLDGNKRQFSLNLPLKLTYSLDFGNDKGLIAYAGPIFQMGITNTTSLSGSASILGFSRSFSGKVDNFEEGLMNRFNIFLGGGVGVQLGDIIFHIGYDHSLLDVDKADNSITSRGQLKVGVGIDF